jgi:hypothetical protein
MGKKTQGRKARQGADAPQSSGLQFIGSLRSQRSVKKQWRLESELKKANAQKEYWERKLTTAREGVARNSEQISRGQGAAHQALESYVLDVAKAEQMISAFKAQAVNLQAQIDALVPTPAQAAERAEGQVILANLALAREEGDRNLDALLATVAQLLRERAEITSKMRKLAETLEFARGLNLDDDRFEALLRMLPQGMAAESAKWCKAFLGRQDGRHPVTIQGGEIVLRETLACNNAFRTGDCAELTKEEEAEIKRSLDSRVPPSLAAFLGAPSPQRLGMPKPEDVAPERMQWAMPR